MTKYSSLIILRAFICFSLLRACGAFSNIDLSTQTLDPSTTGFMITGSTVSDELGTSVSTAGDINGDGYDDIIVGAYGKSSYRGAAYAIYGGPKSTMTNIPLSTQTLNPLITGFMITGNAAGDYLGYSVSTAGDINGDGYDDIIVGAPAKSSYKGAVYVIYGGPKSTMTNIALSTQTLNSLTTGFMITGNAANDKLGNFVSTAGDIDGDGYDDIIVGAYGKSSYRGAVYVIYGGPKSTMTNILLSTQPLDPLTTGFMITGNAAGDFFGYSVSTAGDINKDGYDDIIIGAYLKNNLQGTAYVIYGGPKSTMTNIALSTQTLDSLTTGFMITGNAVNDQFGISVSTAGDINKDGYDDIIVGAFSKNSYKGAAYVIYGGPKSTMTNIALSTQTLDPLTTGFMITGNTANDNLGISVSTAGDINGDGYDDIIVGAYGKSSYRGAAYAIYGGPKSTISNIDLGTQTLDPLTTGFIITANAANDKLGNFVSTAGDINGDGYDDIIVGAYGKDGEQGAAYVIYPCSTCSSCPTNCNTCSSASVCTGCTTPYLLYQSQCVSSCPAGTFVSTNTCQDCSTNCNTCTSASLCTGCIPSYLLYQSQCVSSCPAGTFLSTNICQDCSSNCNTCTSPSVCTGCTAPYLLYQSQCLGSCPAGTFVSTNTCQDCSTNCNTCSSASVCTQCTAPYLLYQSQCLSSCPAGTFVSSNTCQDCSTNCNTCTSASVCTGCKSSYLLYHSQCLSSCPAGTFVSANTCQDCSTNCNTCSSASVCTQCTSPYLLYHSQCVSSCSAGTFVSTNTCQDCSTNCNTCTSTSICTVCTAPYLLYQSQCLSSCPAGTFVSTSTCQDCSANCNTCTSASICTHCTAPYLLYRTHCVSSCPAGTFASANTCQDCPSHCSACTSQTLCQTCDPGYILSNSLCDLSPSPSPSSSSSQQAQGQATQTISSSAKGIGSAVCVGRTAPPVAALVSKTVQNTRYLNLSVTAELAEIYQTWDADMISWDTPTTFSNENHFKTSPYLFVRYGLSSPFLVNFWPTIMNIGISLTLFIVCFVLKKLFEGAKYKGWIPFIMHKLLAGSFNFAFVQAYACLDDILFYLVIDIKTNPFNGSFSWASITAAFTFLVGGCILVFLNFWIVSRYQRVKKQGAQDLKDFNERNKYWEILYSDFNDDGLLSQSFFAILIIRSTLSSFIVATLYDYPLVQASILMALDVAILLFLYFKNPFSTLRGKLAQYYYEVITLLVHICTLILSLQDTLKNSSDKLKNVVCTGIIYLNTALIIGTVGFMFIEIYKTIEKARDDKQTQNRTRRVSPLQPLESDASSRQDRINREQSASVSNFYLLPGVSHGGNITDYDLNMESSRDINASTARELYVNPSSRINQRTNQSEVPSIIRPRPLRMTQRHQRSRYIDTSHMDNAGKTEDS